MSANARDDRIMDRLSDQIVDMNLETMASMFLWSIRPTAFIGSQLAIVFMQPLLSVFSNAGIEYISFFSVRGNVEKLLERIEEKIKIREDEKSRIKVLQKEISSRYGIVLSLAPGVSVEYHDDTQTKIIRIEKETSGLILIHIKLVPSTTDLAREVSNHLHNENTRAALGFPQDTKLVVVQESKKRGFRGHNLVTMMCEWNDRNGNGILQCNGLYCTRSNRLFVSDLKSGPYQSEEGRARIDSLKQMWNSFKCH